jgi:hypothetical protein
MSETIVPGLERRLKAELGGEVMFHWNISSTEVK